MVKNEGILLKEVLPIWKEYPIDKFVFYDDLSTDDTVDVIVELLGSKAHILNNPDQLTFNESHNRSMMLEYSREDQADYTISIDADELISNSILTKFDEVIKLNSQYDIQYYWYNVVKGTLKKYRQDPLYVNNYRTFILPMKNTAKFDLSQWKYHTPRTPVVNLPKVPIKDLGFIHLQSLNERFYALKQLWYKHFEYINYGHAIAYINQRYDPVVNELRFCEKDTPSEVIENIKLESTINDAFDKIASLKGYKEYILKHYNEELVTFGKEYLN